MVAKRGGDVGIDLKTAIGTVYVEEDGSCFFECPSRVPVFFQLLTKKAEWCRICGAGRWFCRAKRSLASAATKTKTSISADASAGASASIAAGKAPQKIKPFFEPGDEPVQEMERYLTDVEKRAVAYLGPNAPQGGDVPTGFSYTREVQPIWDERCVGCHAGAKNPEKADVPLSLLGDERPVSNDEIYNRTKWRIIWRSYGNGTTQRNAGPEI